MMHPFRCEICGETYLGQNSPERCPFCGSAGKLVVPAAEWTNYSKIEMCQLSKMDCGKGLELEINNAAYYKCALQNAKNQITQSLYKRLMKHELEHAKVFATALGIEFKEIERKCYEEDAQNMVVSNMHESMAVKFYTEAFNRAPEPRVRQIFRAFAEVESEHLLITNMYIFR